MQKDGQMSCADAAFPLQKNQTRRGGLFRGSLGIEPPFMRLK